MAKNVAVITDATSSGYFFPIWYRYYGNLFGPQSLNVVTYQGMRALFDGFPVGSLIEEADRYDDDLRATRITKYVANLLERHDVVVRCDVDEFLVPAPRRGGSLKDYVERLDQTYVTAIGLDLIETPEDETLDFDRPLLAQRPWCVETSSLSKTAIVARQAGPVVWAPGFHAATVRPRFDDLYLLHMKFADVKGRVTWFANMRDKLVPGSKTYDYYDAGKAKIEGFAKHLNTFPRMDEADPYTDTSFREHFLETVTRNPVNGIWQGVFDVDHRQIRHRVDGLF